MLYDTSFIPWEVLWQNLFSKEFLIFRSGPHYTGSFSSTVLSYHAVTTFMPLCNGHEIPVGWLKFMNILSSSHIFRKAVHVYVSEARFFFVLVKFRSFRSVRALAGLGGVIGPLPRPKQRWANHRKKQPNMPKVERPEHQRPQKAVAWEDRSSNGRLW